MNLYPVNCDIHSYCGKRPCPWCQLVAAAPQTASFLPCPSCASLRERVEAIANLSRLPDMANDPIQRLAQIRGLTSDEAFRNTRAEKAEKLWAQERTIAKTFSDAAVAAEAEVERLKNEAEQWEWAARTDRGKVVELREKLERLVECVVVIVKDFEQGTDDYTHAPDIVADLRDNLPDDSFALGGKP